MSNKQDCEETMQVDLLSSFFKVLFRFILLILNVIFPRGS